MTDYRIERDTLGEVRVPRAAYYGAQTQRAVENFPISGLHLPPAFIRAHALVKWAAAKANIDAGRLDPRIGKALIHAAEEIIAGRFADQFVVDVFQAGAGTSQNMNLNEVLANRALELLGRRRGDYAAVHPNDHANMSQSTNDTVPTALHVAAFGEIHDRLLPAVRALEPAMRAKAKEFDSILKSGRTHLQDAVPIRLGQEFGAYAAMMKQADRRIARASEALRELAIGGTAVGTGLNTPLRFRPRVIAHVNRATGHKFRGAADPFEATQNRDAVLEVAGALRVLATGLRKIAGDLRLLSSGPRCGLAELRLPPVQPGSSIMPGKINPVLPEMLDMVCIHALGCDTAILHAAQAGQLELNVMLPVLAYNFLQEIEILTGGIKAFTSRCVVGIEADEERCREYAERSPSLATALAPYIGYQKAAALAREALERGLSIRELALEKKLMDKRKLRRILDLRRMT